MVKINISQPTKTTKKTLRKTKKIKTVRDTQPIIIRQEPFKYTPPDKVFDTLNFDHLLAQQLDKFYNEKIKLKENATFNRPGSFLSGDDGFGRSEEVEQMNKGKTKDDFYIPTYNYNNNEIQAVKRGPGRPSKNIINLDNENIIKNKTKVLKKNDEIQLKSSENELNTPYLFNKIVFPPNTSNFNSKIMMKFFRLIFIH